MGEVDDFKNKKILFSLAWSFVLFNYIYADFGFFAQIIINEPVLQRFQEVGPYYLNRWTMIGLAVMMEIPIAMVFLSWVFAYRANRIANIVAGITMTVVILFTLLGSGKIPPFNFYTFYQVIEIAATGAIAWMAWKWVAPDTSRAGG